MRITKKTLMKMAKEEGGLYYMDLKGKDLRGISLSDIKIENVDFRGAILDEANFNRSVLKNCNFEDTVLKDVSFFGASFEKVKFEKAILKRVDFSDTMLKNVNFIRSVINGVSFSDCELDDVLFIRVSLNNFSFSHNVLFKRLVNFHLATISNFEFSGVDFNNTKISLASFINGEIKECNLDVNFSECDFVNVNFKDNYNLDKLRFIDCLKQERKKVA